MSFADLLATGSAGQIGRYTEGMHEGASRDGETHHVVSGAGAWLLAASAYLGAAAGAEASGEELDAALGTEVEAALGMELETLRVVVPGMLGGAPEALRIALACWWRESEMSSGLRVATAAITALGETAAGEMPSQAQADAWAYSATNGQIGSFPLEIQEDTSIVVANALATDVQWREGFAGSVAGQFNESPCTLMRSGGYGHRSELWTSPEGLLGVHSVSAKGLTLTNCVSIADTHSPAQLRRYAHEVSRQMAAARMDPGGAGGEASEEALRALSVDEVFALDLGSTGCMEITEEHTQVLRGQERSVVAGVLMPAWEAEARLGLGEMAGVGAAAQLLGCQLRSWQEQGPGEVAGAQQVRARCNRYGFQAAAVSAVGARATGMPMFVDGVRRVVEIRFERSYAAVAWIEDVLWGGGEEGRSAVMGPWHGVAAFSAWVGEAAPPDEEVAPRW